MLSLRAFKQYVNELLDERRRTNRDLQYATSVTIAPRVNNKETRVQELTEKKPIQGDKKENSLELTEQVLSGWTTVEDGKNIIENF